MVLVLQQIMILPSSSLEQDRSNVGNPTNPNCLYTCDSTLPQYGLMILWASPIPYGQGNLTDSEINLE